MKGAHTSFLVWLLRLPRWLKASLAGLMGGVLLFLLTDLAFPSPPPKTYSQVVYGADSTLLCAYLTQDEKWRLPTSLDGVNEDFLKAIINKEDRFFYYHPGINPFALLRALASNLLSGHRTSGASTLTMQLARMREPAPRTYASKLREMFRALQYEWHYSKEEILEMYLSYLPYGGNVEGVHSAAYLYFDRPPSKLSLSQAILLAVIPNRPNSLRLDRNSHAARQARDKWIGRFRDRNLFAETALDAAEAEPVPEIRYALPPQSPHFCQYLKQQHPDEAELFSTLHPGIQAQAQAQLARHVHKVKGRGVTNGAVLVIDNRSGAVVAYCGSADFHDSEALGQVDGVRAIRSPGSTLKPAAYALAFDRGLLTPKMKLLDLPTTYRGFTPENYDLDFHGEVTATYALAHSLNIPVVRLLSEMGLAPFLDLAQKADFKTITRQREKLGLSLILGGCGVSLEELTHFYSTFARSGQFHRLVYQRKPATEASEGQPLFSEGASYLIASILSQLERPDLPREYLEDSRLPRIAWKTGTSYGRRDAWSIGFSPRYTIGVWLGNFDGRGVPGMSGSNMAVPLLLDLFNALDYGNKAWFEKPGSVQSRKVCAESGLLPGPHCSIFTLDAYLTAVSPLGTCALHREIFVSQDGHLQYCPSCLPPEGFKRKIIPDHDPELLLWFAQNEVAVVQPPTHNPDCSASHGGEGPKILSPLPDFEYLVEKGNEQELLLQAAAAPTASKLYWYVNGRFLQEAGTGEKVFYLPESGKLRIVCMDDQGRKSETAVEVTYY